MTQSQVLAVSLAGIIAPLFIQIVKNWLRWSEFKALVLAALISYAIALTAMWATGEINSVRDVVLSANASFGIATIVYKTFQALMAPREATG